MCPLTGLASSQICTRRTSYALCYRTSVILLAWTCAQHDLSADLYPSRGLWLGESHADRSFRCSGCRNFYIVGQAYTSGSLSFDPRARYTIHGHMVVQGHAARWVRCETLDPILPPIRHGLNCGLCHITGLCCSSVGSCGRRQRFSKARKRVFSRVRSRPGLPRPIKKVANAGT